MCCATVYMNVYAMHVHVCGGDPGLHPASAASQLSVGLHNAAGMMQCPQS